jgi:hypothetical protein
MGINIGMGFGAGMGFGMGMGFNMGLGGAFFGMPPAQNVALGQPVGPYPNFDQTMFHSSMLDGQYRQNVMDMEDDMQMGTRRKRAGSRRMMDGNENLLENEQSRAEMTPRNFNSGMFAMMQRGLQEEQDFINDFPEQRYN